MPRSWLDTFAPTSHLPHPLLLTPGTNGKGVILLLLNAHSSVTLQTRDAYRISVENKHPSFT